MDSKRNKSDLLMTPQLIALDWGTSNLRASLLDRSGHCLEQRQSAISKNSLLSFTASRMHDIGLDGLGIGHLSEEYGSRSGRVS